MMKTDILLKKLAKRFPKRFAKIYHDRVGLMTGKKPDEIHKILLALDLDWQIFTLSKKNCQMLLLPIILLYMVHVLEY